MKLTRTDSDTRKKKLNILHIQALNDTITLKIMKFMHKLAAPEKLFIIHPFGAGICEQIELKSLNLPVLLSLKSQMREMEFQTASCSYDSKKHVPLCLWGEMVEYFN